MQFFVKRSKMIVVMLLSSLYNILSVVFAFTLMWITDAVVSGSMTEFTKNAVVSVACLIVQIILYVLLTSYKNKYIALCMASLKSRLISKICDFSYSYFAKSNSETYESFFLNDLKMFETQYYRQILELLSSVSLLIVAVVSIIIINPAFVVLLLAIIITSMLLPVVWAKRISKYNKNYLKSSKEYLQLLSEILKGFMVIKNFNISRIFTNRFEQSVIVNENDYAKFQNNIAVVNGLMAFVSQILILCAFAIGGYYTVSGEITTGSIVALSQLLTYCIEPIANIASATTNISSVKNIKDNCESIFNYSSSDEDKINITTFDYIAFDGVSFKYPNVDSYALQNINLSFQYPMKYAIIGKNGSGKSTLLKILSRAFDEYDGEIRFGEINEKDISEEAFYQIITYLQQEPFMFNMSVDENINLYSCVDTRYREFLRSRFNICHISSKQIDSDSVSGGEKAKIALIRSLLKDSKCILMDEPTAAMDEKSAIIFDDIIDDVSDKMCVVVTHRIDEGLQFYDKVVIMDKGKVVACGSYEDLKSSGMLNGITGG